MANDNRTIKYTVDLNVNYFKERLQEISSDMEKFGKEIQEVNQATQKLGQGSNTGKVVEQIDQITKAASAAKKEASDFSLGGKDASNNLVKLNEDMARLKNILSELNRQKEMISRGGIVPNDDGKGNKTIETVLAQIKNVKDEINRINALDLNKIIDAKAAEQFREVSAAIQRQKKALDDYNKSLIQSKELSEALFNQHSKTFSDTNATLGKYGIAPQENPYAQGYTNYLANGTFGQRELDKYNQMVDKFWIDMTKGVQLTSEQFMQKAKAFEEQINKLRDRGVDTSNVYNPYSRYGNSVEYNQAAYIQKEQSVAEAEKAYAALVANADKWTIALSRGKQLTQEEFEIQQRITRELQKQHDITLTGKENPHNPLLSYNSAKEFNLASTQAAAQNGLVHTTAKANELKSAIEAVLRDSERWSIALSRGKQITDEELQAAKRVSVELREQAKLAGAKNEELAKNPLEHFTSARQFNTASREARSQSAIAENIGHRSEQVMSFERQISRLQSRVESLYSTYRKAPTEENLQALARTRVALTNTQKEYEKYQLSINGASRAATEFARKAMSHIQWIMSGAVIGASTAIPYMLENELTNIDYKMAGIRQVIPEIEGIEDSKEYGTIAEQITKMNTAMSDFVSIASKYGQSSDEVFDAAKSIGRMYGQGDKGTENTALFTDQAAKMAVADAFSMEEATKGLEAAMAQWNLQTEDSNQLMVRSSEIIDIWTRAAHSGAASGQDISQAIQVAGAAAAQAGISFSFFTSLVETGVRTTARSGNEVGQALKSLFVTMNNGKASKALEQWGIKTKEIGTDGKEHVRSLEKQILDVSLAVSSTEKDTTKFLSTLSGGKYQYSKVAAILKNYKEILRMQGILNDGETKGFADKQVTVQMDTIQRKVQQIKGEMENLIVNIGQNGAFDSLKWMATLIRDITTGLRRLNEQMQKGDTNIMSIAKGLAYIGVTLAGIKAASTILSRLVERGTAFQTTMKNSMDYIVNGNGKIESRGLFADSRERGRTLGATRSAEIVYGTSDINAETTAEQRNTVARQENTAAIAGETAATNNQTSATIADTQVKNNETAATTVGANADRVRVGTREADAAAARTQTAAGAAERTTTVAETIATTANSTANVVNTGTMATRTIGTKAGAAAIAMFTTMEKVATVATRAFNVALAALGGPIGIITTLLLTLGTTMLVTALAEGEEANAAQETADALHEKAEAAQQELDQASRRESAAISIAEAYNKVKASLSTCTEGSEEYKAKEQQLADMTETLTAVTGLSADKFIDASGVKIDAIKKYSAEEKKKHLSVLKQQQAEATADVEATKVAIQDIDSRISALQAEVEAVKATGTAWDWLHKMVAQSKYQQGQALKDQATEILGYANNYGSGGFTQFFKDRYVDFFGGIEEVKRMASDQWNQGDQLMKDAANSAAAGGDTEFVDTAISSLNEQKSRLEEILSKQESVKASIDLQVAEAEAAANNIDNTSLVDSTTGAKTPKSKKGSGDSKKVRIDYDNDELSAAIHAAAQSDKAQSYGFDEALLRAIAARESGGDTTIRQWNDDGSLVQNGIHLGMFQVTAADTKRFMGDNADISRPITNAMTAVNLLAEKFDATGNLWDAVKYYGEGTDEYTSQIRRNRTAQLDSFNFSKDDDFGLPSEFNDQVITQAILENGLPYGGYDWRDDVQKVCTTYVQTALAKAGADQSIVDALTNDANNWSTNAGAAFHSYEEIQNGSYIPKTADIFLSNIDSSGHAGHVGLIGKDGQGYYAAGGRAGESAYYSTDWQVAFANEGYGIEGVIDTNALVGTPYVQSVHGGKKKPKSINDFQLDNYAELQYQQQVASERVAAMELESSRKSFLDGGIVDKSKIEMAKAQLKLASDEFSQTMLEGMKKSVDNQLDAYLNAHPDVVDMLKKRGTTWAQLVPEEKKSLASLSGDETFSKLVEKQENIRKKVIETTKAIEEERQAFEKAAGYMNPDEADAYAIEQLQTNYDIKTAFGDPDALGERKMAMAKAEILESQLMRRNAELAQARANGNELRAQKQAEIDSAAQGLNELKLRQANGDTGTTLADSIDKKTAALARLKREYASMVAYGTQAERDAKKAVDETTKAIKDNEKTIDKVSLAINNEVLGGVTNMFSDMLTQGKSFRDAWKTLWNDIGSFALKMLLQVQIKSMLVKMGMNFADGGLIPGLATGGSIPAYATGGSIPGFADGGQPAGMISGAGTGTSDSILAYLANKDQFVFLSNGEYVMTAEATKRIGKSNLDRMNYNKYADGGMIAPTPYVPNLSENVVKTAQNIDNTPNNPNRRMEQLLSQQTDVIRKMGNSSSSGGVVVLNTQASSAEIMKALQENPRALNALLGRQNRMGFR